MFFIFYVVSFLIYLTLSAYIFIRGWQALPGLISFRIIYFGLYLFFFSSILIGFYFKQWFPVSVVNFFKIIEGFWAFFIPYLFFAALLADFIRILHHYFHIIPDRIFAKWTAVKYIYFTLTILILALITISGYIKFKTPQLTELNIKFTKKTEKIQDIYLVMAGDLHIGNIAGHKRLGKWIEIINKLKPDLVLITGDLFDQNFDTAKSETIIKELSELYAPYGVYAILGNHEYYTNTEKAIECMQKSGIKLLRDQTVTLDNQIVIIGRDDATNIQRKSLCKLIAEVDTTLPMVLLDHQPFELNHAVKHNIDLQLSGHLHSGQIFPYNLLLSKKWEILYGYSKKGNTQFFVTSGLGASFVPIRLGTRPEIVRIRFLSSQNKNNQNTLESACN